MKLFFPWPALAVLVLGRPGTHYRAAVVEIGSIKARSEPATLESARKVKLRNAAMIEEWTAKAASKGAHIVVFGEDFADSGWNLPIGAQNLYAEPLPWPGTESLCTEDANIKMPLASTVACTAEKHNITIATGLGDLRPCVHNMSPFTRKSYPCDNVTGLAAFNSIGVFGPAGNLLAKYHKTHLARSWDHEYEPQWAEVSPPEVVSFDAPFGVRFGVLICNDINFGGPTRALMQAGVRDILFPTLWINFGQLFSAVGMQDGYSRAYGVNLLAANGNELGLASSGSGIWPADLSSSAPQFYTSERTIKPGQGWMGIADLVSPDPSMSPVPAPAMHPSPGSPFTAISKRFEAVAGKSVNLTASADGVHCNAEIAVASGSGTYALIAGAGLANGGWYSAVCAVATCKNSSDACNLVTKPGDPLPVGGAIFENLTITASFKYGNTFLHSAMCDGGLTVAPRSLLSLRYEETDVHVLQLSRAPCPLMSSWVEARAQSEDEQADCPYNKYPCSTGAGNASQRGDVRKQGSALDEPQFQAAQPSLIV